MSTVDPTLAARARRERRPGGGRVAALLAVQFVGGVLAGFGWSAFAIVMGSVGAGSGGWTVDGAGIDGVAIEAAGPPVAVLVAIAVGMILVIAGSIGWAVVVMKRSDVGLAYGAAAVLGGGGIGALATTLPSVSTGSALVVLAVLALVPPLWYDRLAPGDTRRIVVEAALDPRRP